MTEQSEYTSFIRKYSRIMVRELGLLRPHSDISGLTYTEGHFLLELEKHQFLTGVQMARILNIDKGLVSRMTTSLEKRKLVSLSTAATDKRIKNIRLTEEGLSNVRLINDFADKQVNEALKNLTSRQIQNIESGLKTYAHALTENRYKNDVTYRLLEKKDSPDMEKIIINISSEFNTLGEGGPAADYRDKTLFASYQEARSVYFVAEREGKLLGGGGLAPLAGVKENICEIRNMYLLPEARGLGIGQILIEMCLNKARLLHYDKCYLETINRMKSAIKLYEKMGFEALDSPVGCTGHNQSECWFIKDLK